MKTKESVIANTGVWVVRAKGLPRLLIEASTKFSAEDIYKHRFHIKSALVFEECDPCQPQQSV